MYKRKRLIDRLAIDENCGIYRPEFDDERAKGGCQVFERHSPGNFA